MKVLGASTRSFCWGLVTAIVFSGCTSTLMVGEDPAGGRGKPLTYGQIQDRLQGKHVRMFLRDGRRIPGYLIGAAADSIRFDADTLAATIVVPTSTVRCIEKTDHAGGGILGILGGTMGGFLLGGGIGMLTRTHGGEMSGLGPAIAAVGGAGLGALGGTLYGTIHGIVTRYEFPADTLATEPR